MYKRHLWTNCFQLEMPLVLNLAPTTIICRHHPGSVNCDLCAKLYSSTSTTRSGRVTGLVPIRRVNVLVLALPCSIWDNSVCIYIYEVLDLSHSKFIIYTQAPIYTFNMKRMIENILNKVFFDKNIERVVS